MKLLFCYVILAMIATISLAIPISYSRSPQTRQGFRGIKQFLRQIERNPRVSNVINNHMKPLARLVKDQYDDMRARRQTMRDLDQQQEIEMTSRLPINQHTSRDVRILDKPSASSKSMKRKSSSRFEKHAKQSVDMRNELENNLSISRRANDDNNDNNNNKNVLSQHTQSSSRSGKQENHDFEQEEEAHSDFDDFEGDDDHRSLHHKKSSSNLSKKLSISELNENHKKSEEENIEINDGQNDSSMLNARKHGHLEGGHLSKNIAYNPLAVEPLGLNELQPRNDHNHNVKKHDLINQSKLNDDKTDLNHEFNHNHKSAKHDDDGDDIDEFDDIDGDDDEDDDDDGVDDDDDDDEDEDVEGIGHAHQSAHHHH